MSIFTRSNSVILCVWFLIKAEIFFIGSYYSLHKCLILVVSLDNCKSDFFAVCEPKAMAGSIWHEKNLCLSWSFIMWNKVNRETCSRVLLFSTMSLISVKPKFELIQSFPVIAWEVRNPLSVSFERCCCSYLKLNLNLEKRCASSLLTSRPVIWKWIINSYLAYAGEVFLPKAFTMNHFRSAVKIAIFLSLGFWFVFFTHNNFSHLTSKITFYTCKICTVDIN